MNSLSYHQILNTESLWNMTMTKLMTVTLPFIALDNKNASSLLSWKSWCYSIMYKGTSRKVTCSKLISLGTSSQYCQWKEISMHYFMTIMQRWKIIFGIIDTHSYSPHKDTNHAFKYTLGSFMDVCNKIYTYQGLFELNA